MIKEGTKFLCIDEEPYFTVGEVYTQLSDSDELCLRDDDNDAGDVSDESCFEQLVIRPQQVQALEKLIQESKASRLTDALQDLLEKFT